MAAVTIMKLRALQLEGGLAGSAHRPQSQPWQSSRLSPGLGQITWLGVGDLGPGSRCSTSLSSFPHLKNGKFFPRSPTQES